MSKENHVTMATGAVTAGSAHAAYNPQRYGIFDNNLAIQKRFTFRFAVGTTF